MYRRVPVPPAYELEPVHQPEFPVANTSVDGPISSSDISDRLIVSNHHHPNEFPFSCESAGTLVMPLDWIKGPIALHEFI